MRKLILMLLGILFLTSCSSNTVKTSTDIKSILSHKAAEFKGYSNRYTISDARKAGFFVEDIIPKSAPPEIIHFIEYIWQDKSVDVSIAKVKQGNLILSYLIYQNNKIYVLDYNKHDETYKISEYKYLTYDYDKEKGIQSRYLTNDKSLSDKDKLTEEQKSNCYYLCSYLIQ